MSKKILTLLAPVAAIVAFMAIPAMAQATTQLQAGGVEAGNNLTVRGQSSNLKTQTQDEAGGDVGTLSCTGSEFEGTVASPQGSDITGKITKDVLTGCKANEFPADVTTNAGPGAAAWELQVQEPVQPAPGAITAHLIPASGSVIQFTVQPQFIGSVTTCDYSIEKNAANPNGSLQLSGIEKSDESTITGTKQFMKQSGSAICGQYGDLSGTIQTETTAKAAVSVDMT